MAFPYAIEGFPDEGSTIVAFPSDRTFCVDARDKNNTGKVSLSVYIQKVSRTTHS